MFDQLKNLGQLAQIASKAQKLQEEMKRLQEQMASRRVTGEAGDGRVVATVTGRLELLEIRFDRDRMEMTNVEMVQDLVTQAVRAAQYKAAELVKEEMGRLAQNMGLPPEMLPTAV